MSGWSSCCCAPGRGIKRLIGRYIHYGRIPDRRLLFSYNRFSDPKSILQWILTFGKGAELLEPREIREELCDMGKYLQQIYQSE